MEHKKLYIYLLLVILLINIVDQMGLLFLQFLRQIPDVPSLGGDQPFILFKISKTHDIKFHFKLGHAQIPSVDSSLNSHKINFKNFVFVSYNKSQ